MNKNIPLLKSFKHFILFATGILTWGYAMFGMLNGKPLNVIGLATATATVVANVEGIIKYFANNEGSKRLMIFDIIGFVIYFVYASIMLITLAESLDLAWVKYLSQGVLILKPLREIFLVVANIKDVVKKDI